MTDANKLRERQKELAQEILRLVDALGALEHWAGNPLDDPRVAPLYREWKEIARTLADLGE